MLLSIQASSVGIFQLPLPLPLSLANCEKICKHQTKVGNTEKSEEEKAGLARRSRGFLSSCFFQAAKDALELPRSKNAASRCVASLPRSNSKIDNRQWFSFNHSMLNKAFAFSMTASDTQILARGGHVLIWSSFPNETANGSIEYNQFRSFRFCTIHLGWLNSV